ncbi:MAG: transglutaminase domain-containing protein [Lachnospiraceae bacterium]|nr:transglutaminase domain-containing protein [Lachnospiraceae bacterium]
MRKHKKRTGEALIICTVLLALVLPWKAISKTEKEAAVWENRMPLTAWAPETPESMVFSKEGIVMDVSYADSGYVMIQYNGSNPGIKVQITRNTTYTYDLNLRNGYEIYPFTEGNGSYSIKVFENISGNQYSQLMSQTIFVSLSNEFQPFLVPNQYVNFRSDSMAVVLAAQLAVGKNQLDTVNAVYQYVTSNITYDYAKAQSVRSGYLPDIDKTLQDKKGICFDYAALMAAMLRSQNIPTKLVIGYAGDVYHAWVSVFIKERGWIDNLIWFDGEHWSYIDPTFMATGKNSQSVRRFVGNSSNYVEMYAY